MITARLFKDGKLVRISPFPNPESAKAHLRWLRSRFANPFDRVRFHPLRTREQLDELRKKHDLIN